METKLEKNVICLIFVIAVILLCSVCLTGCLGSFENDTLLGVDVTCGNIKFDHDSEGYLGEYSNNRKPDLNYKVYACYSNNRKKELEADEYSVTYRYTGYKGNNERALEELPESYAFGYYYINISYKDKAFTMYFKVDKDTPIYSLQTDKTTWKYGENQPVLSVKSSIELGEFDVTYKYVKAKSTITVSPTKEELADKKYYPLSEDEKRLEPGRYFLFAEIAEQEDYKEGMTNYVPVTVEKANLVNTNNDNYPLGHQFHEFTYEFTNVLGNVNAGEITLCSIELKNEVNADMKYTIPVKIIASDENDIFNCANYEKYVLREVKLNLGEDLSKYYNEQKWYCNIKAEKGIVYIPYSMSVNFGYVWAEIPVGCQNYWTAVSVIRDKGSSEEKTLDLYDGNNNFGSALPSGTYTYTFSLKDKDNFVWFNERTSAETTEDIVLTLVVK